MMINDEVISDKTDRDLNDIVKCLYWNWCLSLMLLVDLVVILQDVDDLYCW